MKVEDLNDNKLHYKYSARCRHCEAVSTWGVDKEGTTYSQFQKIICNECFPNFIRYCGVCKHQAVFDLTAFSKED